MPSLVLLTFTMLDSLRIFKVFDYVFVYSESARFWRMLYFVWAHPTEIGVFLRALIAAGLADQSMSCVQTASDCVRKPLMLRWSPREAQERG